MPRTVNQRDARSDALDEETPGIDPGAIDHQASDDGDSDKASSTDVATSDATSTGDNGPATSEIDTTALDTAARHTSCSDGGVDDGSTRRVRVRRILRGKHGRRFSAIVLALVTVAALAFAGWFGWQWKTQHDIDHASTQALAVAQDYAVTLTSVSADSIDQDFTAVLDGATGEFKDMYAKSSDQLRQLLIDNKADAEGKVIASGVSSASPTEVTVLLFVDQSVRNASTPEPRIDRSRVTMTMQKVDGRWLASKVELP